MKSWKWCKTGEKSLGFKAEDLDKAIKKVITGLGYEKYIGCNIVQVGENNKPIIGGDFVASPVLDWWKEAAELNGLSVEGVVKKFSNIA